MNTNQLYDKYKRDKKAKAFYNSKAWEKCRELALKRDDYLCARFKKDKTLCASYQEKQGVILADVVHHIKELKDYPELALSLDNLEGLCHACHNKEHPEKGGGKPKKKLSKKIKVVKAKKNPEIF